MKKAIIFGNYTNYKYHPLKGVDCELEKLINPFYDITITEDCEIYKPEILSKTDLVVLYVDLFNASKIETRHVAALISYVSMGGSLLILHNGISLVDCFEFMQLAGGKFIRHPKRQPLSFFAAGNHPIMDKFESMTLDEEPYQLELCSHTDRNVFLEYEFEGERYPAGWSINYCMGKVVYLMPGHTPEIFQDKTYQQIITNALHWL